MTSEKHTNQGVHVEFVFDERSGLYRQVRENQFHSLVFANEQHAKALCAALAGPYVCVTSREQLLVEAAKPGVLVAFVDVDRLLKTDGDLSVPMVGIVDDARASTLPKTVGLLDSFPWLSHVITMTMLSSPHANSHLAMLVERLSRGFDKNILGAAGVGRVALLAQASRRQARFERMEEFFAKHGLSARIISAISEVSEELVMNALYDAPVEAGYFKQAVPRTVDVDLPVDRACEISYGVEAENAFVRVRDTFGALTRARLQEVLNRCTQKTVALDETRGGAGLGLWRVFSSASTIAITVIPGRLTDILIGIASNKSRIVKQLHAVHLFFQKQSNGSLDAMLLDDEHDLVDQSITLVLVA